jgi:hypothetical protein
LAGAIPLPLNLPPVDDGVADLVDVNRVVAGSMETCIVDDIFEEVEMDVDVEDWEVEVEDETAEGEVARRAQSEYDKGV